MTENVFGASKETICEKLYLRLFDEFDIEPCKIDSQDFQWLFQDVLKDYSLVLKSCIIE